MNAYEVSRFAQILSQNEYPGCGIALGMTPDGKRSVALCFITGRTLNSRNRFFVEEEDGVGIRAFEPKLIQDARHILYRPVYETDRGLILANGDQSDILRDYLSVGKSWEAALRSYGFEDDRPNATPRISGLLCKDGSYRLSVLKAESTLGRGCARSFYEYAPVPGLGHYLHSYDCHDAPVPPSLTGEPRCLSVCNDMELFADILWDQLNGKNKISLFLRYTDLETGEYEQRIFNKRK